MKHLKSIIVMFIAAIGLWGCDATVEAKKDNTISKPEFNCNISTLAGRQAMAECILKTKEVHHLRCGNGYQFVARRSDGTIVFFELSVDGGVDGMFTIFVPMLNDRNQIDNGDKNDQTPIVLERPL